MSTPCHVEFILEERPEKVQVAGLGKKKRAAYRNSTFKPRKAKTSKKKPTDKKKMSDKKKKAVASVVSAAKKGDTSVAKAVKVRKPMPLFGKRPTKEIKKAIKSVERKAAKKANAARTAKTATKKAEAKK